MSQLHHPNVYATVREKVEADQNMPPQTMVLWLKDYFELKAIEKKQIQDERSVFPSLPNSRA